MPGTDQLLIGDIFANSARAVPDRTAVIGGDPSLTFAALESTSNRMARALASLGIARGSRVALWGTTTLDAVPLFAALSKLGAVFVPVNGHLGPDEAMAIIGRCGPQLLVTGAGRTAPAGAPNSIDLGELGARAEGHEAAPVAVDGLSGRDPHVIFYTSGSTGPPKGAVLSHATHYRR